MTSMTTTTAAGESLQITMLDSARSLGLTTQALATELRGAFFGLEASTLQRDREDVDIRVRFPEERRRNVHEFDQMRVATAGGTLVPLCEVARVDEAEGTTAIRRIDQRRAVVVVADVDQDEGNSGKIIATMGSFVRDLERRLPGVRVEFAGNKRENSQVNGIAEARLRHRHRDDLHHVGGGCSRATSTPLVVLMAVPFGVDRRHHGALHHGLPSDDPLDDRAGGLNRES